MIVEFPFPIDLKPDNTVEVLTAADGRLWINVQGECVLRAPAGTRLRIEDHREVKSDGQTDHPESEALSPTGSVEEATHQEPPTAG